MAKIFGIDLGTTYSCISFVNEYGQPEVVANAESMPVTPSVVAFEDGGSYSVGDAAKNTLLTEPENVCSTIKRQMGKRDFTFNAFGVDYGPESISALILKKLVDDACIATGENPDEQKNVVITCPAYFGLDEREATRQAGLIAGLNVLAILNEPTAAAISYGLQVDQPQTVMVYDLGGGTFDVTVLKVENGKIRVIATGGDHMLGGKDWDNKLRDYVVEQYCAATGESIDDVSMNLELMGELELLCETAKKALTTKKSTMVKFNREKIEITLDKFNELTQGLLDKTIPMVRETLDVADKKGIKTIDKILMVGGSTFMPQVKEKLTQEFPGIPVEFCDPNQSVAKGAAIYGMNVAAYPEETDDNDDTKPEALDAKDQAEIQNNPIFQFGGGGKKGPIDITNVISQSIAVRLYCSDNKLHIVNQIYKNSEIPLVHELHAGTYEANQTTVLVEIFENSSDQEYVEESDCKELVNGELGPLPENLPANAPIDVLFNIDKNGLLSIDVEYKPTGVKKHLEVKLANVLSKEEVKEETKKINALRRS